MTISSPKIPPKIKIFYPEGDGKPVAESDITRDYLLNTVYLLGVYFKNRPEVYVSGNLFIYYEQGNPKAVLAPDVFVIIGVGNQKRRIYKAWEEGGKLPDFVMEITSATTRKIDEENKPLLYAQLGVTEYFQYDPSGDYLRPQLKGRTLVNGVYQPIEAITLDDGTVSIPSQVLGLDVRLQNGNMNFFSPHGERLLNYGEGLEVGQQAQLELQRSELVRQQVESELQQAQLERQQAESDFQQAELARQQVESELQQAQRARQQAIPQLLSMGLTPEQVATALSLSLAEVEKAIERRSEEQ
jgi:Uma2 family endonuclease